MNFARAEVSAVQRREDSLQPQYDGQLRSHVHALQDECRYHVRQEEDKLRKQVQQALGQESSACRDQLQQALRHHACQEECADQVSTQEMTQLRLVVAGQEDAMMRLKILSMSYLINMKSTLTSSMPCSMSLALNWQRYQG